MAKKIKYKKPDGSAYDAPPLNHYIQDEMGQWAEPDPNFNLQDAIKKAKSRRSNSQGFASQNIHDLIFSKPKTKKK